MKLTEEQTILLVDALHECINLDEMVLTDLKCDDPKDQDHECVAGVEQRIDGLSKLLQAFSTAKEILVMHG